MTKKLFKPFKQKNQHRQAIEDYLKAIYKLSHEGSRVTTNAIAQSLGISAASVTNMVKKLGAFGFVRYRSYQGVEMLPAGRRVALEVIRHHRLIELFLHETLGYAWDDVHEEAERLEHFISEKFEEKIFEVLGRPQFDPHGDPIPSKSGQMVKSSAVALANAKVGERHCIERVSDHDRELLRYLGKMGLIPSTKLKVVEIAPFQGPFTLQVGRNRRVIGREALRHVFTRVL